MWKVFLYLKSINFKVIKETLIFLVLTLVGFFLCHLLYQKDKDKMLSIFLDSQFSEIKKIDALDSLDTAILEKGAYEMLKHKIIIAGITRDNLPEFAIMKKSLEEIGNAFSDYRIVLFENDSSDGTKNALSLWQKNNSKVKIISKDFYHKKRPSHKFLAEARNYYIKEIQNHSYDDFDILMVIDMDMAFGIDIRSIQSSFAQISKWDVSCSNGIKDNKMWDAFAFRSEEFPHNATTYRMICDSDNHDKKWNHICGNGSPYWNNVIPLIQRSYSIDEALVPLHSCFGGMSFYKRDAIKECLYDSLNNDCEHVQFNDCIRLQNKGVIYMNPAQIVLYS